MPSFYDILKENLEGFKDSSPGEVTGFCPFMHNGRTDMDGGSRSLAVNYEKGLWKCFSPSCEKKQGNDVSLVVKILKIDFHEARKKLGYAPKSVKEVPIEEVRAYHERLLKNQEILDWLEKNRGILPETVMEYQLGYAESDKRLWIPVRDVWNRVVDVRRHLIGDDRGDNAKNIAYRTGYGDTRLFPMLSLDEADEVILCEGELDCICARQRGFSAFTVSGTGAGGWNNRFNKYLVGKKVAIVYDCDDAGRVGAKRIAEAVYPAALEVKIVDLELSGGLKDVTDFFVKAKGTEKQFRTAIDAAVVFTPPTQVDKDTEEIDVNLADSSLAKLYGRRIAMRAMVVGKDLAPFIYPKRMRLSCPMNRPRLCPGCGLAQFVGNTTLEIDTQSDEILQYVNVDDKAVHSAIAKKMGMPPCSAWEYTIEEAGNIEEIKLIPELDYSSRNSEYVMRNAYYVGHGLKTNHAYAFRGISGADPETQHAVPILDDAQAVRGSLDDYTMTPDMMAKLSIFKAGNTVAEIRKKLDDIYEDLSNNVTNIYDRNDLLTAVDLIFHSVLRFQFKGVWINKGWTEGLIIGDTREGKSVTVQKIIEHYRCGEFCLGESASFAGLMGGIQTAGKRSSITWGKIPLNDRRLVAVDELSGLSPDVISLFSGIRSSGVAEISKILTERTWSRTRIIWLSNSRSGRKLETYNYGILAVKELMGKTEDISRLDFALTVANGEVSQRVINRGHDIKVEHKYTSDLCSSLVLWAWTRKESDVEFTKEAEESILDYAEELGERYSSQIPLVQPAEQRIKIARLAVALACRLFSTPDGEKVRVLPCHVEFVAWYLNAIYSKQSMGYDLYSKAFTQRNKGLNGLHDKLLAEYLTFAKNNPLTDTLLSIAMFKRSILSEAIGWDKDELTRFTSWGAKYGLLQITSAGFVKTPTFMAMLKEARAIESDDSTHELANLSRLSDDGDTPY